MSSSSERVILVHVDGIGRRGGIDTNGNHWLEFTMDPFCGDCDCDGPECDPDVCPRFVTECSICGASIGSGWTCLDGGGDVCEEHVSHDEVVPH